MKLRILITMLLAACLLGAEPRKPVQDKVSVQIIFEADTEFGPYRDALYMTVDDWVNISQEDIDVLKKARVDHFVDLIKHPPAPVEPTKEQLEAEVVEIDRQKASLEDRKIELTALIAEKTAKEK
jgi:hypothetical protein